MTNVYILDFGNRIKIGRSDNVKNRVKAIESAAGEKVHQIFHLEADDVIERLLHIHFKEYRTIGEYFTCDFDVAKSALKDIIDGKLKVDYNNKSKEKMSYFIDYNQLIQKSYCDLSIQEKKIVQCLISEMKIDDEIKLYEFSIKKFCKICDIEKTDEDDCLPLKKAISKLFEKSVYIKLDKYAEVPLRWIEKAYINEKSGVIKIRLDEDMKPYLLESKNKVFNQP